MKVSRLKKIIKNIPWLYSLLVSIWLIVLGMIAYRYFTLENRTSHYLLPQHINESVVATGIGISDNSYQIMQQLNNSSSPNERQLVTLDWNNPRQFINLEQSVLYTERGELHAVYNYDNGLYTLFFNRLPISQVANPNVIYAVKFLNNNLVLIFDNHVINGKQFYSLLEIRRNSKRLIHELGNFESMLSVSLSPNQSCILLTFAAGVPATGGGDYQLYQYCGGNSLDQVAGPESKEHSPHNFFHSTPKTASQSAAGYYLNASNRQFSSSLRR